MIIDLVKDGEKLYGKPVSTFKRVDNSTYDVLNRPLTQVFQASGIDINTDFYGFVYKDSNGLAVQPNDKAYASVNAAGTQNLKLIVLSTTDIVHVGDIQATEIQFDVGGDTRWRILGSGHLQPLNNNTLNLGSTTARVANVYAVNVDCTTIYAAQSPGWTRIYSIGNSPVVEIASTGNVVRLAPVNVSNDILTGTAPFDFAISVMNRIAIGFLSDQSVTHTFTIDDLSIGKTPRRVVLSHNPQPTISLIESSLTKFFIGYCGADGDWVTGTLAGDTAIKGSATIRIAPFNDTTQRWFVFGATFAVISGFPVVHRVDIDASARAGILFQNGASNISTIGMAAGANDGITGTQTDDFFIAAYLGKKVLIGQPTGPYATFDSSGMSIASTSQLFVGGLGVVGYRKTGWGAPTGTTSRATFDTGTVTLSQLAQRVAALINDLTTHGLIGA